MLAYLYLSTHTLRVVATEENGTALTSATVTATLVTSAGVGLEAGGVPVGTLNLPESATPGTYSVTVPHNLDVQVGQRFFARVTSVKSGVQRYAELAVEVTVDRT